MPNHLGLDISTSGCKAALLASFLRARVWAWLLFALLAARSAAGPEISRAFELRYVTGDAQANGETDFKGSTTIFSTEQRIEFLRHYERVAGKFSQDPDWDKRVVSQRDAQEALRGIKPQPLPAVRRRLPLTSWRYLGTRPGQREEELAGLSAWNDVPGLHVDAGELLMTGAAPRFEKTFAPQSWRFRLQWRIRAAAAGQRALFDLGGVVVVGLGTDGRFFFRESGGERKGRAYSPGRWHELLIEVDLETGRYNFNVDGAVVADFVPVLAPGSIDRLTVQGSDALRIDDLWGTGYAKLYDPAGDNHTRDVPFSIRTFLDETFSARPAVDGWERATYDDGAWAPVPTWPYAHGGERHAGETLYLRSRVTLGEFERGELSLECVDPSGEVWINGRPVEIRHDRRPFSLDVTRFLRPNAENLIAIRVDPNRVTRTMRHTPADLHTGWFAGRLWLDLTARRWIKDVFVRTESLAPGTANVALTAMIRNDQVIHAGEREVKQDNSFRGHAVVSFFPWFPQEASVPSLTKRFPVFIQLGRDFPLEVRITIPQPELWTPESPRLYRVAVQLEDDQGQAVDDFVVTTGLRTVSQEGGTFRINGRPAMMNGGLVFGFRGPLHRIAQWLRCPPDEELVREILLVKRMNGNTLRMSQHDGPSAGVNDPRYAEIGDQLGVMFQWGTTAWIRTDSPYLLDFRGLPDYIRQVRNHPSIVMWQPANHPQFPGGPAEGLAWFGQVYETIWKEDRSRLIAPVSSLNHIGARNDDGSVDAAGRPVSPAPEWVAPGISRGNMDHSTGYGADWSELRTYPFPSKFEGEQGWREPGFRTDYLNSPVRAYFDFESEESNAQSNWKLLQGKPYYRIRSYEVVQDRSVGRELALEEWRLSQAWQAMSGYEAYRKKRWLDYDGMIWCTLDGGGNTGTYEKPLTDYHGHAKMSFYTVKMAFQPVLAGSKNVDTAYGPADRIPVAVFNLGDERRVDVTVRVLAADGEIAARRVFRGVTLPGGRSCTDLPPIRFELPPDQFYMFEHQVTAAVDDPAKGAGWEVSR